VVVLRVHPHVRGRSYFQVEATKEAPMPGLNQQMSPHGTGSGHARWIAIAAVVAAVVAVGVVLLVLYGGSGGVSTGY
jgi:hypothetical protein